MKTKMLAVPLTIFSILLATKSFADDTVVSPEKGKAIFTTQCSSCHNVNKQLVGPALADVDKRHTIDWLVSFIRSPKILITKNDKEAVALYNQFNQIIMPDHLNVTVDDVKNVLAYIKSETKSTPGASPFAKPVVIAANYHPLSVIKNAWFFVAYIMLVAILIALFVFAVNIKDMQRKNGSA